LNKSTNDSRIEAKKREMVGLTPNSSQLQGY